MADIETEGFDEAIANVQQLSDNLEDGLARHIDDEVERLKRAIRQEIKRQGLVDTGDLLASFIAKRTSDSSWTVYSTEEHADYLEFGTSEHTIRPDEAQVLAFEPENPAQYGDNYDPETGYVYATVVEHPGNEPYNFVENAQRAWAAGLTIGLRGAVRKEIVKAGFSLGGT